MADDGLTRLGRAVRRARESLALSIDNAAAAAPIAAVTWGRVEKGLPVRGITYAGIERVLGWPPDTAKGMLTGDLETPPPAHRPAHAAPEPTDQERRDRADALARDDALIDSIWASELSDEDKLELVQIVIDERAEAIATADRRARERFAERLRWRRQDQAG